MNGKRIFKAAGALALAISLAACSQSTPAATNQGQTGKTETNTAAASTEEYVLSFVAADKTNWDKEVTIGDYAYTVAVNLLDDGSIDHKATCTGKAQASGGPGMGFGGGQDEEASQEEEVPEPTDEEKQALSFTKSGSWTKEEGYGYNITVDGYSTKTSFDKASSRQEFYMTISNNGETSDLTGFQAKDTAFRKEMAADYQEYEVREAAYIFEGTDNGTNNNPNSTHLYLENDGVANALTYQGSSPTYKRGTWSENGDGSLTLSIGGSDYSVDYCDAAGKEGYRVTYNSMTMYCSKSGEEIAYTSNDFEGADILEVKSSDGTYTMHLTESREIYDPDTDAWYWLDALYDGARAAGKEVWLPYVFQGDDNAEGKWVRYDKEGKMIKGWYTVEGEEASVYPDQAGNTYYYDPLTGAMAKGTFTIEGKEYTFDALTGVLIR